MEKIVDYHKINPLLSKFLYLFGTKVVYPTIEYNKEKLVDNSYIFAPNHSYRMDGPMMLSLLSHKYDVDTFMYKEFWINSPIRASLLSYFNVYPITRNKLVLSELKEELQKLKNEDHSLIIFPQGRYVDPEIMKQYPEYHIKTIPRGAFYLSALSQKSIIPVYLEPQKPFSKNTVVYGNPLDPREFDIISERGSVKKNNLEPFVEAWLNEINKAYEQASEFTGRKMRPYRIRKIYRDASGSNELIKDPNNLANYFEQMKLLEECYKETGITNIYELAKITGVSSEQIEEINEVKETYEKSLLLK